MLEGSSLSIITDILCNQNYNKISLIGQCMCHASNLTMYLDSLHVVPGTKWSVCIMCMRCCLIEQSRWQGHQMNGFIAIG